MSPPHDDIVLRDARTDELDALLTVQRAHDLGWFGAVEHDEADMKGLLDVTERVTLVGRGGRDAAFAARWPQGAEVVADPSAALSDCYPPLLAALAADGCPEVQFFAGDERLLDALATAGWSFGHSIHDLSRPVSELALPEVTWPAGVELRPFADEQAEAVHRMLYVDAGWAEVVGHHDRTLEEWSQVFLEAGHERPIVAWRGDAPVAASVTKVTTSGQGHVAQIAVSRRERGGGLGRALLVESFRRLAGRDDVTSVGLEVIATNRKALDLYLSVGLQIHREHQAFLAPKG